MAVYQCSICGYLYDEEKEGTAWGDLPDDWTCPACANPKSYYSAVEGSDDTRSTQEPVGEKPLTGDPVEPHLADIHEMALTGESAIEPMRTREPVISWDDILFIGAQLAKLPLNEQDPVNTQTVIGPSEKTPLVIDNPLIVTHMSFGALSKEAKISLSKGSALAHTAMSSGEGGILPESIEAAYKYIFEYVPNRYSVTESYLMNVDAVEIKLGQSAKPGMGGHLPGRKVTAEIAEIRNFREGEDIISPAHHEDIFDSASLAGKIAWLREKTDGKPIGVKIAAGNIEDDLAIIVEAKPDFITVDGRAGATGAAPKMVKRSASVPTMFALHRAQKALKDTGISLIITGGLRISSDFAKALAMGADAIAIGTSALMAIGCRQYRMCHTGACPMGITTHDPELRKGLNIDEAAKRLSNFLNGSLREIATFARMTGNGDIHRLSTENLCTVNSEISGYTDIAHV